MRKGIAAALAFVGLVALGPGAVRADVIGKTTAATSASGVAFNTNPAISVTIEKGKKKRMLLVTGIASAPSTTATVVLWARVNGIEMEPQDGVDSAIGVKCDGACTLTGSWWLDIDAAEAANPGVFVSVPLIVEIEALSSGTMTGKFSVTASMVKK